MVERFARMVDGDLPDFTLPYCRKMTLIWCAFFVANAAMATTLAALAPHAWWTLYTGVISYALIGLLLVGEVFFGSGGSASSELGSWIACSHGFFRPSGPPMGGGRWPTMRSVTGV